MRKIDKDTIINIMDETYEEYGLGLMTIVGLALTLLA
jgi:hypothetical protein